MAMITNRGLDSLWQEMTAPALQDAGIYPDVKKKDFASLVNSNEKLQKLALSILEKKRSHAEIKNDITQFIEMVNDVRHIKVLATTITHPTHIQELEKTLEEEYKEFHIPYQSVAHFFKKFGGKPLQVEKIDEAVQEAEKQLQVLSQSVAAIVASKATNEHKSMGVNIVSELMGAVIDITKAAQKAIEAKEEGNTWTFLYNSIVSPVLAQAPIETLSKSEEALYVKLCDLRSQYIKKQAEFASTLAALEFLHQVSTLSVEKAHSVDTLGVQAETFKKFFNEFSMPLLQGYIEKQQKEKLKEAASEASKILDTLLQDAINVVKSDKVDNEKRKAIELLVASANRIRDISQHVKEMYAAQKEESTFTFLYNVVAAIRKKPQIEPFTPEEKAICDSFTALAVKAQDIVKSLEDIRSAQNTLATLSNASFG